MSHDSLTRRAEPRITCVA